MIEACIVCAGAEVEQFLTLGLMALANQFLTKAELSLPEPRFDLTVGFCHGCGHVQLTEHVPPAAMFKDYLYVSSASETLRGHLYGLSDVVAERCALRKGDLVIDVGANDGTLLKGFLRHGVTAVAVDPATNLAELYDDARIQRRTAFFDSDVAQELRAQHGPATVVTATNTFPHIPALDDFVRAVDVALAPGGTLVIEAHYLGDLLKQRAFDTIYHEHVSYWHLGPMVRLFEERGMRVVDVQRLPIHHGQLRAFVQRAGEGTVQASVPAMLEEERAAGLNKLATYQAFARQVERIRRDLKATISRLRADGRRIVGYGAPAKGNTILGYVGLGPADVDYIVDRSSLKQGLYTPGTHIPVVEPERLLADQPDFTLLLAWNFADEILEQQAEYRARGGRFITPVPEVRVVE